MGVASDLLSEILDAWTEGLVAIDAGKETSISLFSRGFLAAFGMRPELSSRSSLLVVDILDLDCLDFLLERESDDAVVIDDKRTSTRWSADGSRGNPEPNDLPGE